MKKILHKMLTSPRISIILRKIVEVNFRKQKKIIKKYFPIEIADKIVDVGCGTGEFSVFFPAENYIGIDIDPANIEFAKNHYKGKFIVADGKALPFENNSFSKAVVVGVFHHLSDEDAKQVLLEIDRVLKPDGCFLVMEDTKCSNPLTTFMHYIDQGEHIRSKEKWNNLFSQQWNIQKNFTFKNGICFYSMFLLNKKNGN